MLRISTDRLSLSQQLALAAAACCLLVGMTLVGLGVVSSRHTLQAQQQAFGSALASQLAHSVGGELEVGDLLGVAALLQRFVDITAAEQVAVYDLEGKLLGRAGAPPADAALEYRQPVRIDRDVAGEVALLVAAGDAASASRRLMWSLGGLAVLLSAIVFGAAHHVGQRLSRRLQRAADEISLEDAAEEETPANVVALLERRVAELPMDLLRTRSGGGPRDENYRTTAVLYLHLTSLVDYVDTLDEESLIRYTRRLHRVVYAAAGFYAGELHVARQFGLSLYFGGDTDTGSAAFRAVCCAWLIQAVCRELQQQLPLSMSVAMAVGQSELGAGDSDDIYPGLYIQHTVDELHNLCALRPPQILLSPAVCADIDVDGRLTQHPSELRDYGMLESFSDPYDDLLERQLRLILRRLGGAAA